MAYSKIAFICGPYRANNGRSVLEHIRSAEAVAIAVWKRGYVALCPHKNTAHFDGILPDEAWLAGDLAMLDRCDCVVTVPGWTYSAGSRAEVEYARANEIPVYHAPGELP
jgi:nucleoside 2-deoxyribosyltransferase